MGWIIDFVIHMHLTGDRNFWLKLQWLWMWCYFGLFGLSVEN